MSERTIEQSPLLYILQKPKSIPERLKEYFDIIGPFGFFIFISHISHFIIAHLSGVLRISRSSTTVLSITLSFASLMGLYFVINTVFLDQKKLRSLLNIALLSLMVFLNTYLYMTKSSLDYTLVADNGSEKLTLEAFHVLAAPFKKPLGIGLFSGYTLAAILFLIAEFKYNAITWKYSVKNKGSTSLLLMAIYAALVFFPTTHRDEIANVVQAMWNYHYGPPSLIEKNHVKGSYPLIKTPQPNVDTTPPFRKADEELPNIVLVLIESFNARYVGAKMPDGTSITPNFERLSKQGLVVERFYGNSIQTSKGHFTTLFGTIPPIRGKVFRHHTDTSFQSLPDVLRSSGYETVYIQGYSDLGFDNTHDALTKHGFDLCMTTHDRLTDEDKPYVWGWGPEDHVFYRHAFSILDEQTKNKPKKKPIFATFATISTHMRFRVPAHRRMLYPEPKSTRERYINAVHLSDKHLGTLFDEISKRDTLRNTIVIVTGDHSFPVGDHGIEHNEHGFYEESFRTPFLMIWPGKLASQRITDRPASQLDIAPTLLSMLGISPERHHFQGQSIFTPASERAPIPLVQPYNGTYLGAVHGSMKYLKRLRTGEELLFDLDKDPRENQPLPLHTLSPEDRAKIDKTIETIQLTHHLISTDEVWCEVPQNDAH